MTLILEKDTTHVNLVLRFLGALDREDYLQCRDIKDKLKLSMTDNQEIEGLIEFTRTCNKIANNTICQNTVEMLQSLKI